MIAGATECRKPNECPQHLTCMRMSNLALGCGDPCIWKECEKGEYCSVTNHKPSCYTPQNNAGMSKPEIPQSPQTQESESSSTTTSPGK